MIEVLFTKEATDNLVEQAQYIYQQTLDLDKADKYLLMMKNDIINSLGHFPYLGRPVVGFGEDIRKFVHMSFTILYKIQSDKVYILTIYRENLPKL